MGIDLFGVEELTRKFAAMERAGERAVVSAVRKCERTIVTSIRKQLGGEPRWGYRGKSDVYSESVKKGFRHRPRSGPPGKFTGDLRKGIGGRKKIPVIAGEAHGGVGVGGPKRLRQNNFKKNTLERRFPYVRPGFEAVKDQLPAHFSAAIDAALTKVGLK